MSKAVPDTVQNNGHLRRSEPSSVSSALLVRVAGSAVGGAFAGAAVAGSPGAIAGAALGVGIVVVTSWLPDDKK